MNKQQVPNTLGYEFISLNNKNLHLEFTSASEQGRRRRRIYSRKEKKYSGH
jgi:hypothetical protein